MYVSAGYQCARHYDWTDVTLNIILITRIGTDGRTEGGPGSASGQGCTVLSLGCQIDTYSGTHPVVAEGQVPGASRLTFTSQNGRSCLLKCKTHLCLLPSFKDMWSCTSIRLYWVVIFQLFNYCNASSAVCVTNGVACLNSLI